MTAAMKQFFSAFQRLNFSSLANQLSAPFNLTKCHISTTQCSFGARDRFMKGTKISKTRITTIEGTVGSEEWLTVDTSEVDEQLPTIETLKKRFNGILYEELPIVYIKATRNNTLIEGRDCKYNPIVYTSSRLEGFLNARKKTSIAGTTTGYGAGQKLLRRGVRTVRVRVRGLGPGRMTAVKGLTMAGIEVVSITDFTRLPELGPRPRKARRL